MADNPWEDYATPAASQDQGPWNDFGGAQKPAAAPSITPAEKPTSQTLGFLEGITKPLDTAAAGAKWALNNAVPFLPHQVVDRSGNVVAQGTGDILDAAAKWLGFPSVEEANAAHQKYFAENQNKPGGFGKFAGELVGTAPVAALTANPFALGAASGALLTDKQSPVGVAEDATIGAGLGKLGDVATKAVSKALINPIVQNPTVQKLVGEGVELTPGQIVGGVGKRLEDAATSIPFIGDAIKAAQNRATQTFNIAAISRALAPISRSMARGSRPGRDAVDQAYQAIGGAYDNLVPHLTGSADQQLSQDFNDIGQNAIGEGVKQDVLTRFNNILDAQVRQRLSPLQTGPGIVPQGQQAPLGFTGQALKDAQSNLGNIGRRLLSSGDADDRQLGSMVMDAQGRFNDMIARQNPGFANELAATNRAYAQMARVVRAASSVGADEGVFTAKQFSNAVKALDRSKNKNAYARGKALMQDLSDPARAVLPSSINDSGTATRLLMTNPVEGIPAFAASLPAWAIYNRPVLSGVRAALTAPRPQAIQSLGQLALRAQAPASLAAAQASPSLADLIGSRSVYPNP